MESEQTDNAPVATNQSEALLQVLSREQLIELGEGVLDAIATVDLAAAVAEQVEISGEQNPNRVAKGIFFGPKPDGLPMSDSHVYRSVDVRAINDLASTGVVRGAFTATDGARANTRGHSTYWSQGRSTSTHNIGSGQFVLAAPSEHAQTGWVTADQLTGIYAKDAEGTIHNIIQPDQKD